jgi:hypothetical protein
MPSRSNRPPRHWPPDQTTISRTRRLIDLETQRSIFGWVLRMLAEEGLVKRNARRNHAGDNAALRSVEKRHTEEAYNEFLEQPAEESGIEAPTRAQLASSTGSGRKRTPMRQRKPTTSF